MKKVLHRTVLNTAKLAKNENGELCVLLKFPKSKQTLTDVKTIPKVKFHGDSWSCPLSIPIIEKLLRIKFILDEKLLIYYKRIKLNSIEPIHPEKLNATLLDFQAVGVGFLELREGRGIIADEMGLGKEQPLTSKILTPTGWTTMGDIKVNDSVIGSGGLPIRVKGVYPQGLQDVYRVSFSDDTHTECGFEHLWNVQNSFDRSKNRWWTLSLSEILEKPIRTISNTKNKGGWVWNIPIVKPINFSDAELPLHPYLLGFLLGNGNFCGNSVRISFPDAETANRIKSYLPKEMTLTQHDDCYWGITAFNNKLRRYDSNPVMQILNKLDLRGVKTENKFIPHCYMFSTIENRLLLLQGLLDSDGYAKESGTAEFDNCSKQLIQGVLDLVRSLGGIAIKKEIPDSRGTQDVYRIYISMCGDFNPFLLKRKRKRFKTENQRQRKLKKSIVNIEFIGKKQCQCISVAARDGLYVTDDFIVTHNTIQALGYIALHPKKKPKIIICTEIGKLNWDSEIKKFLPKEQTQVLFGRPKNNPVLDPNKIIIVNYDILSNDIEKDEDGTIWEIPHTGWVDYLIELNPEIIVFDECQKFKNDTAERTKAVMKLGKASKKAALIPLSGTPIENRPIEIFNALHLVEPIMFPNRFKFAHRYCGPVNNGFGWSFNGHSNEAELFMKLQHVMIRRLKKDVYKQLPDKQYQYIPIPLSDRTEYEYAENNFMQFIEENAGQIFGETQKQVKAKLNKQLKISFDSVLEKEKEIFVQEKVDSTLRAKALRFRDTLLNLAAKHKINNVISWLEDFLESGEKIVVFAKHKEVIDILYNKFKKIALKIDGSTKSVDRKKAVDAFQNDLRYQIIIISEAAAECITLTAAFNIALAELSCTPGKTDQIIDRVHRIGQMKTVFVYYLLAVNTIEEQFAKLLDSKREVINQVIDGTKADENTLIIELMKMFKNLKQIK